MIAPGKLTSWLIPPTQGKGSNRPTGRKMASRPMNPGSARSDKLRPVTSILCVSNTWSFLPVPQGHLQCPVSLFLEFKLMHCHHHHCAGFIRTLRKHHFVFSHLLCQIKTSDSLPNSLSGTSVTPILTASRQAKRRKENKPKTATSFWGKMFRDR